MDNKKIIIIGAYGGHNLGDDAIVDITVQYMKRYYNNIDLVGFYDSDGMYFANDYTKECQSKFFLYSSNKKAYMKEILLILLKKNYEKMIFVDSVK